MSETKDRVRDLLSEANEHKNKRKRQKENNVISITNTVVGDHAITVGQGNVYVTRRVQRKVIVDHGPDSVTPAQKRKIKQKIDELVEIGVTAGGVRAKLYSHWWSAFNNAHEIEAYQALPQDRFDEAMAWLRQQKMIKHRKLRRTDNDQWRKMLYGGIYAKLKELGMPKQWVYDVVLQRLHKKVTSLTQLGERDLKRLYEIVRHIEVS